MVVKITKQNIFWNNLTDNKPSKQYLDNLEQTQFTQVNLKVNQTNYFNLTIVAATKDITYLITNHNNYKQYWFFNGIEKILPNGYVLNFQLDIYTTYTLSIIENMKANNALIKLNRTHKFTEDMLFIEDELIDSVSLSHTGIEVKEVDLNNVTYDSTNTPSYTYTLGVGKKIKTLVLGDGVPTSGCVYYVFIKPGTNDSYILVPVLNSKNLATDTPYIIATQWPNQPALGVNVYNTNAFCEELLYGNFKPYFVGKFLLCPLSCFYETKDVNVDLQHLQYGSTNKQDKYFLTITIPIYGIYLSSKNNVLKLDDISTTQYNIQVNPQSNYSNIHQLWMEKLGFRIFNEPINIALFRDYVSKSLVVNRMFVGVSQVGYIKLIPTSLTNYSYIQDNVIEASGLLPYPLDTYQDYLNSTRNTRDTQLGIYKQQFNLNNLSAINGFVSDLAGTANSYLFSKRSLKRTNAFSSGLINGAFDFGLGLANQIFGYQNQLALMRANLKDSRRKMGVVVNATSTYDTLKNSIHTTIGKPCLQIEKLKLTPDTIQSLNNILYLWGHSANFFENINNAFVRGNFNYLLFDKAYLAAVINQYINPEVPVEIRSYILDQLGEGVRIWNTQPNN